MPKPTKPHRQSPYSKPVIGLAGGIGSGKSFVAKLLEQEDCGIINSDQAAYQVLRMDTVKAQLRQWWGDAIFAANGQIDRKLLAAKVFGNKKAVTQLNNLIHPHVHELRHREMERLSQKPEIRAIVWDTPLLFEVGLDRECDAVIFIRSPYETRLKRVQETRNWDEKELKKREKLQISLDKKEEMADYSMDNSGEVTAVLRQIREILPQIITRKSTPA